jgi:transcriptional regulator with XRE-family HTH domain
MSHRSVRVLDEIIGRARADKAQQAAARKHRTMTLREVRKEMGFTQAQVAKAMGVTQSALSQIESQGDMRLATLRRMVTAMGGDVDVVIRYGNRRTVVSTSQLKSPRRALRAHAG